MHNTLQFINFAMQSTSGSSTASSSADAAALTGFLGLFGALWVLWFVMFVVIAGLNITGIVFWIMMIVDAAKREFKNENDKIMWILILVFTSWVGALVYYFVVKKKEDAEITEHQQ